MSLSAVVILEDGLLLAGSFLDQVLSALGTRTRAVVRHLPPRRNDPLPANIKAHLTRAEFLRLGMLVASRRAQRLVPGGFVPTAHQRLATIARRHRVPFVTLRDLNGASARRALAAYDADLFVTSLDTIVRPEVLAIPHVACVNQHASLLPARAGRLPVFHALAHGDAETGVTIHEMTERIDDGRVLAQESIAIRATDTFWWLSRKAYGRTGAVLAHALRVLEDDAEPRLAQPRPPRSYHSVPSADDWARFRAQRRRFI